MSNLGVTLNDDHEQNFIDKNGAHFDEISVITLPNGSNTSQGKRLMRACVFFLLKLRRCQSTYLM